MSIQEYLSKYDMRTLEDIGVGFQSKNKTWLSTTLDGKLALSDLSSKLRLLSDLDPLKGMEIEYLKIYLPSVERKKMSATLKEILVPMGADPIDVQFISPHAGTRTPTFDQLELYYNYHGNLPPDKYCLVPGEGDKVDCIPVSEASMGNNIWTVHFFDRRTGRELLPTDRHCSIINNNINNNRTSVSIGRNSNRGPGTQSIGSVGFHQGSATTVLSAVGLACLFMTLCKAGGF